MKTMSADRGLRGDSKGVGWVRSLSSTVIAMIFGLLAVGLAGNATAQGKGDNFSERNIKITRPSDMDLARLLFEQETART